MANLEQLISQKAERDKSWREQRQMERENAYDMQDAGIVEVTSNPEMYGRYLAMQGDNPMYSPGNVVLVMFTKPEFTQFGTRDRWKTLRRYVPDSMVGKGTQIFAAPGSRNPFVEAYDITQTEGRPIERLQLADDSPEMESALNTLLNHAVVPITVNHDLESPAFYDEVQMELLVNPSYPDRDVYKRQEGAGSVPGDGKRDRRGPAPNDQRPAPGAFRDPEGDPGPAHGSPGTA